MILWKKTDIFSLNYFYYPYLPEALQFTIFCLLSEMDPKQTDSQQMKPKLKIPQGQEPHVNWWYPPSNAVKIPPRRDSVGSESSDVGSPSSPTMMGPQNFSFPPRGHKPTIFKEFDFVH